MVVYNNIKNNKCKVYEQENSDDVSIGDINNIS